MAPQTPSAPVVVLASASPRRRKLLSRLVADFEVVPADLEERLDGPPTPEAIAALALAKARAVARGRRAGVVLGADTVVVVDGEPLGKPAGAAEARAMLRRLRGRHHEVVTGVAVVEAASGQEAVDAVVSRVLMEDYPDPLIEDYVASGEPLDKAGAYAIQGGGRRLVAGWAGSFSNIVGLPLEATRRLLQQFGVAVTSDVGGPLA